MSEKSTASNEEKRPVRNCRKTSAASQLCRSRAKKIKEKEKESLVRAILKKEPADRTSEEKKVIIRNRQTVKVLEKRAQSREWLRQKSQEVEDSAGELEQKVAELARVIDDAEHVVVYTGAGISTAASIPDYRGPNGVWTLIQQGKESAIRNNSLVDAEPTLTHMALSRLVGEGKVKHIVSQNCDGLHLRSGIPPDKLSELHGNMYIEACMECEPERQFIRLFDVTEQTSLRRHRTSRKCHKCGAHLRDTIVHFGEKGVVEKPLNWASAVSAADDADAILCLGSSLKVLRRYQCLWNTDKPKRLRPELYIVNLQWTPKDSQASLKINGRCDDVMTHLMKHLNLDIPQYSKNSDPIFQLATPLRPNEMSSYSTKTLSSKQEGNIETRTIQASDVTRNHNTVKAMKVECGGTESESVESDSDTTVSYDDFEATEETDTVKESKVTDKQTTDAQPEENMEGPRTDKLLEQQEAKMDLEEQQSNGDLRNGQDCCGDGDEDGRTANHVPGWFGKGYRKRVVKRVGRRRRSRVSSAESGT